MKRQYGLTNVDAIATGVDTTYYTPSAGDEQESIAFCGSMDWMPNEDGMIFFLTEILPLIRQEHPNVNVVIIGRNPSPTMERISRETTNVTLTGWVDDVRPYLNRAAVVVVPLRVGGGTRMKIYEAMAMAKAVVSTTLGAEGLPVRSGEHLFIEDHPASFADRVAELLRSTARRRQMGNQARDWVDSQFRWERVGRQFAEICMKRIGVPAGQQEPAAR